MLFRFVTGNDFVSRLILVREGSMASWIKDVPSHVEMAGFTLPDGSPGYLGAHDDGGVKIRPVGYDKSWCAAERFVDYPLPNEAAAITYARSKIGEPYDFAAILDLAAPAPLDLHLHEHCICSALATQVMAHGGAFASPLGLDPHLISPATLLFWMSGGRVKIPNAD